MCRGSRPTQAAATVAKVLVTRNGAQEEYSADIVVVACGALSSALLLLRSANDKHPTGLANGSDQVGRNYMRHNMSILMALLKEPNNTVFQKTLAVSDFYFGADDFDYPLGLIQMCAASHGEQIRGEALPSYLQWLPEMPFDKHVGVLDQFLAAERGPAAAGEPYLLRWRQGRAGRSPRATRGRQRPETQARKSARRHRGAPVCWNEASISARTSRSAAPPTRPAPAASAHDPETSVLNLDCRAHQLDNLYVTDASFFPSIGAVNPR